ncbi:MAG: methyltransferase domain-containing protein, partial [Hyphomicrobiaceae bacterium]|nr:methyltransferase domain-containing protein [Hyphomicrobiaceae bacterium]
MHHYLEHTRDPRAELAAARTALAPGGHLLIEVPDPERSWARRAGRYWGPWLQPQHLQFLPIDGLCAELARQGFTVLARERGEAHQPVDYSSFVGMLSQDLAPKPDKPWLPRSSSAQRAGRLAVLGVIKFDQIANFSDEDIANVDEALGLKGRIERDNWVRQAQDMMAEATAAEVPAEGEAKA